MKRILLLTTTLLMLMSADANQISEQDAKLKARQFFEKTSQANATRGRAPRKAPELKLASNRSEFFVFNDEANGGYVVVSGEDRMPDILAYSYDGQYDADNIPCNMRAWLEGYAEQVKYLRTHPEAKVRRAAAQKRNNIYPLLTCKFSQTSPYNDKCPVADGYHCATGCVATAIAQIMFYYKWPKQTTDSIPGYTTKKYKIEMPTLPITTIDWDNILNDYNGDYDSYTSAQREAIATLMLLCGMSVQMDYTPSGSGTLNGEKAFWYYFGYNDNIETFDRDNFETEEWEQLIYDELDNGRPVYYGGSSNNVSGHAFVLDGYENGYFHINWGWGGAYSYVLMTDISGWNGYTKNHGVAVGIQPDYPDSTSWYSVLDNGVMTMYFDKEKNHRSGTILKKKDWAKYGKDITECVIDSSFANLIIYNSNLESFFSDWPNLESIRGLGHINTSKIKTMRRLF